MKLTRTLILMLALAGSAYAGNIQNESPQPPPPQRAGIIHNESPQPAPQQQTQSTEPITTPDGTQAPTVTEIVLTVVSILGLI